MKRAIAIVIVNICLIAAGAELVSLAVFYYQHGWLFYRYPFGPVHGPIPETQDQRLTQEVLHPYFGPTHMPGIPFDIPEGLRPAQSGTPDNAAGQPLAGRGGPDLAAPPRVATNNFGFVSPYNYPYVRKGDNQVLIGIFGGSVALWFCQVGADRLMEHLKQNTFFKNKELVSLCLSHEGYKQPQQLLLLSYFLSIGQQFDLVVNIDGFNEVSLSSLNDEHGLDISMPSFMHLDPLINLVNQSTLTPDKLRSLAEINHDKELLNGLAERMKTTRFASVNLALEQYYSFIERRYRAELLAFSALPSNPSENSLVHPTPSVRDRQGTILFDDIARNWVNSSILMNDLLAAKAVPYFHFLQPNQYYTSRVFGADEAAVALSNQSPFKTSVEKGYPFLAKELELGVLRANRVNAFNGIHLFDDEPAPVYMDNCCHYTLAGNNILADFIATSILNSEGAWKDTGAARK